jgi:hypothetical protein
MASVAQGQVQAQTAMMNAKLRARELISQAQVAENQALQQEREGELGLQAATAEREATAFEVGRAREVGTAFQAQQRVDVAGAGLEATGSPLLVMAETARQLELDRQAMTHAGEVRAREAEEEARMSRYGAQLSRYQAGELRKGVPLTLDIGRYQARAARFGGRLGATTEVVRGVASTAKSLAGFYGMGG